MRLTIWMLFIALVPGVQSRAWSASPNAGTADEKMLMDAGLATDGPGLLEFFRKRTLMPDARKRIEILLRQLGDNSFKVRSKASAELVGEGVIAIPFLRQAMRDKDLEVVYRAEECIRLIEEKEPRFGLPAAAARLLAVRKPAGALEALLEYAPYAEDEVIGEEVLGALAALAAQDGKPDKTLIAALGDRQPQRRAVAIEALCRAGLAARSPEVRGLLKDSDPQVRLRAALALATAHERDALPVLIDLLPQLPQTGAWQAEDLLLRLAGEQAPLIDLGHDEAAHRQCRDAWLVWWRDHGAQADLTRLDVTSVCPFGRRTAATGSRKKICHAIRPSASYSTTRLWARSGTRMWLLGSTSMRPPKVVTLAGRLCSSLPVASRRRNRRSWVTQAISPLASLTAFMNSSPVGRA